MNRVCRATALTASGGTVAWMALVAGGVILVMLIGTYHLWQQIVMALTGGL